MKELPTVLRAGLRSNEGRPVRERLVRGMAGLEQAIRVLPQSLLGQTVDYAFNLCPELKVYPGDEQVAINNDLLENAIHPTALGERRRLSIEAANARERAAIVCPTIESSRC